MNTTTVQFFGGPHDGLAVNFATVRPVVFLPTNPEQVSVYTRVEGAPLAMYQLIGSRYVYAGVRQPEKA